MDEGIFIGTKHDFLVQENRKKIRCLLSKETRDLSKKFEGTVCRVIKCRR